MADNGSKAPQEIEEQIARATREAQAAANGQRALFGLCSVGAIDLHLLEDPGNGDLTCAKCHEVIWECPHAH